MVQSEREELSHAGCKFQHQGVEQVCTEVVGGDGDQRQSWLFTDLSPFSSSCPT